MLSRYQHISGFLGVLLSTVLVKRKHQQQSSEQPTRSVQAHPKQMEAQQQDQANDEPDDDRHSANFARIVAEN